MRAPDRLSCITMTKVDVSLGGRPVLADINLAVETGEFLCVIGPSGCGKTTLLRLAAGLIAPTAGRVDFLGDPLLAPKRELAVVFQDYGDALLPWRTAAGNVSLVLETMRTPKEKREAIVTDVLARVGLAGHGEKYPRQLSGGMQQRLQIARCLAQEPQVWLMDEPFGALDAITRQALQDEILQITSSGSTVLFVTHDLEEAIYLGDRIVAMGVGPGHIARVLDVPLPRPRDRRTTFEEPEFRRLRRVLLDFIKEAEH